MLQLEFNHHLQISRNDILRIIWLYWTSFRGGGDHLYYFVYLLKQIYWDTQNNILMSLRLPPINTIISCWALCYLYHLLWPSSEIQLGNLLNFLFADEKIVCIFLFIGSTLSVVVGLTLGELQYYFLFVIRELIKCTFIQKFNLFTKTLWLQVSICHHNAPNPVLMRNSLMLYWGIMTTLFPPPRVWMLQTGSFLGLPYHPAC